VNFWPEVFTNPVVTGVGALVEEELVEEELVELGVEDVDLTVVDEEAEDEVAAPGKHSAR